MAFEVKGEQPEWRLLYERVKGLPVDAVVTYEQLDEALGRSFRDDRGPLDRAQTELLEANHRVLVNVRNVGYRVARAEEHLSLAQGQRKRARRAVRKGRRIAEGADRGALSVDDRRRLDEFQVNLREQENMLNRTERRVSVLEKENAQQDDRIDYLEAQIQRLVDMGMITPDEGGTVTPT